MFLDELFVIFIESSDVTALLNCTLIYTYDLAMIDQ